jgi:hypothetical protein
MQTKPSIVFCHGLWADGSCVPYAHPSSRGPSISAKVFPSAGGEAFGMQNF